MYVYVKWAAIALSMFVVAETQACSELLDVKVNTLAEGRPVHLCNEYQGKVVMVVNTASKCGFTHQYDGLEALYEQYRNRGFVVLGFPSNDFGQQEPGSEKQIQDFCRLTYGVKFPMFSKTGVTPANASELYRRLGQQAGEYPQWNFHKYLLDREGRLVKSFASRVDPKSAAVVSEVERLL